MKPKALLFDMLNCGGCARCVKACMDLHGFAGDPERVKDLSATAYTCLRQEGEDYTVRNLCRHCLDPACASVCPVGALVKTEEGPVVWEGDRCLGCRYCMVACPFSIPRYEWDSTVPCVRKCDMCIDRIREGKRPACAEACPHDATVFGDRDEILAEARRRIKKAPREYHDHVYGETEIGGTSVLFLAPFPVESLGFKKVLGTEPLPALTASVLKKIPTVLVCGGAALLAIWWITKRRDEVAIAEATDRNPRFGGMNR
jgi:formate dehydrogenase iron-sulfur subunit